MLTCSAADGDVLVAKTLRSATRQAASYSPEQEFDEWLLAIMRRVYSAHTTLTETYDRKSRHLEPESTET